MKSRIISLLLSTALTVSIIAGCGNANTGNSNTEASTTTEAPADSTETDKQAEDTADSADSTESSATEDSSATDDSQEQAADSGRKSLPASFEELISSLHAGQSYAYAPICEGEDALLVTSYVFDDLEGHLGTYEATIFMKKDNAIEKVTTVQSGGTAYPIAVADNNSLILPMRNSITKGYVSKETGEFVITDEANVDYINAEDGEYHNYKEGASELPADSSLFDELSDTYQNSEIISFEKAGVSDDGTPNLSGAVYAAYNEDEQYNVLNYYIFNDETSGSTQTHDGVSGVPFTYEQNGDDLIFHFASADDTTEAKYSWNEGAYPMITFTGDNKPETEKIYISCLGNQDPETFDAEKYYDNDNNLLMQVKSFDETSLTGDLYRDERIKAEYVDNAKENDIIYSINGTPFTVVSFEEANKEVKYGTDEEFKKDCIGTTRFDGFLVKKGDDDLYCALEKEDYSEEYNVVYMLNEGAIRKLVEENVTFKIKENCEIILQKFVKDGDVDNLTEEYLVGREFKGDNYPGWSDNADEYYMTTSMLVELGVIDGELYTIVQKYVP